MSKYEAYISMRSAANKAIEGINLALGRARTGKFDSNNDKHILDIRIGEMGYGYYGSSNYYTIDNEMAEEYLTKACKVFASRIGDEAIKEINIECERLRQEAEREAQAVLLNTQVVGK